MGKTHDQLATIAGDEVMLKIRNQETDWKQIFSSSINRIGAWDWPRADYICFDNNVNASYAFEFKPPKQSKREYLTGLGQSMAYLQNHNYVALLIPERADDNFEIAKFIKDLLNNPEFGGIPLSLIVYDENTIETNPSTSIRIEKPILNARTSTVFHGSIAKTFWCWWRDSSNYEVFLLLELSDRFRHLPGDIYTDHVFPLFFRLMTNGKTLQWDGTVRNKSGGSYTQEKQNYKIPLFQLGLWNQADGRLTFKGYKLLNIGKIYGPGSIEFMDYLSFLVLVDGKHLELIQEVQSFQKVNAGNIASTSEQFVLDLEQYLSAKGAIGPRKPTAVTTGAKGSYIRDEPKLWKKLGFLETKGLRYFKPNQGYEFDWERITRLLMKDFTGY